MCFVSSVLAHLRDFLQVVEINHIAPCSVRAPKLDLGKSEDLHTGRIKSETADSNRASETRGVEGKVRRETSGKATSMS